MKMKASIPGVSFKQSDGTTRHFRNSEYIPYFYIIPKEVVEHFGKQFWIFRENRISYFGQ